MAHHINYNSQTEKHSFFSVKQKAWHGLGQVIEDYPTSAEAIRHAGLDYTVEKRPLFTVDKPNLATFKDPDADDYFDEVTAGILVPDFYANVREDTEDVLGVVGKDYQIVQNMEAFSFFDSIVGGKDGVLYETAGALGKGERIFITAKLPDYIRVGRNDCIEKYIFLTTSHDGYGSITAAFTPVRIVCQNTLNAALKNHTNSIKIRHTSSASERLKQAHRLMGLSNLLANELEQVFNQWSKIRITDQQVKKLVQMAMGKTEELSTVYNNVVDAVTRYAFTSPTQQDMTTKGTLYGAYNAVTGYYQNVRNYKDEESKFKSILYGTGLQRGQTAFDLCTAFAKTGSSVLN
jgi:phage/plasmid-like protein (TIGR03299 family)